MMGTGRFDQDTFSMGGGKKKTGLCRVLPVEQKTKRKWKGARKQIGQAYWGSGTRPFSTGLLMEGVAHCRS